MKSKLSIAQRGLIVILVLIASELVFVSLLTVELNNVRQRLQAQRHNRRIIQHINNLAGLSQQAGAEMFKSIMVPIEMHDQFDVGNFEHFVPLVRKESRTLRSLMRGDQDALDRLDKIDSAVNSTELAFGQINAMKRPSKWGEMSRLLEPGRSLSDQCDRLLAKYHSKSKKTKELEPNSFNQVRAVLFVGIAFGMCTMLAAFLYFKRMAARLLGLTKNSELFLQGEPLDSPVEGSDEIAELDALFFELVKDLNDAFAQERFLIQYATDVVCSVDTRGYFIDVSSSALEQWGYTADELIERNVATTLGCTGIESIFDAAAGSFAQQRQFLHEDRLIRKDGKHLETLWSMHWSPSDGYLFCCVRDITETKLIDTLVAAQEELVRNVIEYMPIGILKVDDDGNVLSMNATARSMFARGETADLGSFNLEEQLERLDENSSWSSEVSILSGETVRCRLPQERSVVFDVTSTKILSDSTRLVLINDVTERYRLDHLKGEFVNLLGRNLHEPLESTRNDIKTLIAQDRLDAKMQARLVRIHLNINRLLMLIDQLLTVNRLGSDRLSGELVPCSISDAVLEAVESVRDYAEQQRIELRVESVLEREILADYQRLVQVIVNLISNAIKYSPEKTTVSLVVSDLNQSVEVRIVDQGRGVPEEKRLSIFEPFVQAESSDARRGVGTGLGLSICKRIITEHNGSIGVDRGTVRGSEFWIRVPAFEGPSAK